MAPDGEHLKVNESSEHWSLEKGYSDDELNRYPIKAIGTGYCSGLSLTLSVPKSKLEYICAGASQGFKVAIHNPGEDPRVFDDNFVLPLGQDLTVKISPKMMKTSDSLVSYPSETRQCFFNHERHLKYFKIYTQKNCDYEGLANFTFSQCDHVKFSMPRQADTKVCTIDDLDCYNLAENLFMTVDLVRSTSNETQHKDNACNCLPACTSIGYDIETTQNNIKYDEYEFATSGETSEFFVSQINIYFKEAQFSTSQRSELYGLVDFLANIGGLYGKF